jgi:phosphoribosylformylglycinamidine cyclo-ligase
LHTDGVGSKVLVAQACHRYDTIGVDCVAMNVNDVICLGAEPLALVNYLALEKARPKLVEEIMIGLRLGAREAEVAIVSGETAVLPEVVNGFDLAATVVGLVRKDRIITGDEMRPGDVVLGLRSNGIHSNGLTLARKLFLRKKTSLAIARELLRPTRIYVKPILRLLDAKLEIHGLAHITGGGYSKLKRIGARAKVGFHFDNLPNAPWIFRAIQAKGRVSDREMLRTYNMGVGFLVICSKLTAKRVKTLLPEVRPVGRVTNSQVVSVRAGSRNLILEKY